MTTTTLRQASSSSRKYLTAPERVGEGPAPNPTSHAELLERTTGLYHKLWTAQRDAAAAATPAAGAP